LTNSGGDAGWLIVVRDWADEADMTNSGSGKHSVIQCFAVTQTSALLARTRATFEPTQSGVADSCRRSLPNGATTPANDRPLIA